MAEKMTLEQLLRETLPYLRDEASHYEDDGSNEPLELARQIETALESGANLNASKGEAVAWQYREVTEDGPSPVWDEASRMHFEILRNDRRYEVRELYTHTASPDVVRDAERYRWLRNDAIHYENQDTRTPWVFNAKNVADYDGWPVWGQELDNLVDAAMAARKGGE